MLIECHIHGQIECNSTPDLGGDIMTIYCPKCEADGQQPDSDAAFSFSSPPRSLAPSLPCPLKYPSTPYHPLSPSKGDRADRIHKNPDRFVDVPIVITEKLDGSNTLIHGGQVYGRSVAAPSTNKWMAMVKKHHAWKVTDPDTYIYGENLFGVHSIEYDAMREEDTFRVFAVRVEDTFLSFDNIKDWCMDNNIPTVPRAFQGALPDDFIDMVMSTPEGRSHIGRSGREGWVMRIADSFHANDFSDCVCKTVRPNHVQTDQHWTRNWKPCKLR